MYFLAILVLLSAQAGSTLAGLVRRDCTFSVTASSGDTCASLSAEWGITEAQFVTYNPSVGASCANGVVSGQDYCVEMDFGAAPTTTTSSSTISSTTTSTSSMGPSPTQTGLASNCVAFHKVVTGDTCSKIVSAYNGAFTLNDFYSWNPAVGNDCSSLILGYYVCVGIPGTPTGTTVTTSASTSTVPAGPSPTQTGIVSNCNNFYEVSSGDSCQSIVDKYRTFTLDQFYSWNPAVGNDCSLLYLGYYVCVGVPGTPTAPITTSTSTSTTSAHVTGPTPTQTGIISTCDAYYKVASGDSCQSIVDKYKTFSLSQFYSWNPAVGSDCSTLFLGYYVCVGVPGTPTAPVTTTGKTTTTTSKTTSTTATAPTPTQTGITSACKSWYKVVSGDTCQVIVDKQGDKFTLQQFYAWNPAVGTDCSHLFLGYYVCVGV